MAPLKLLVPLDTQQPTDLADLVAFTARRLGAEVHLLSVMPPNRAQETFQPHDPYASVSHAPAGDTSGGIIRPIADRTLNGPAGTLVETRDQAIDRLETAERERLEQFVARLVDLPVSVRVVLASRPAAGIAAYATENAVDLLLMRTHGRIGLRRAAIGSVAEEVVRAIDTPVMLAGPAFHAPLDPRYNDLVVCLDGSSQAEEILPIARWVRSLPMHVTVVTAVDSGRGHPDSDSAAKGAYVERIGRELRNDGVDADWAVIPGHDPAAAIVGYAAERPTSIVGLITRARSSLPRLVIGSVAMKIVHDVRNPVIVLHAGRQSAGTETPA
jgi:nucleotide-binding universal stress UspA family protein